MLKEGDRDSIFALFSIAVSLILLYEAKKPYYEAGVADLGVSPVFFPLLLIYIWLVLSILILTRGLILRKKQQPTKIQINFIKSLKGFLIVCLYAYLMPILGFYLASVFFSLSFMTVFGYQRKFPLLTISFLFPLLLWYIFTFLLNVSLPVSPWFFRI